jgi:hypothetical protein
MTRLRYVGEWLTFDQAAKVLGCTVADLRPLHQSGDIDVEQIRPGVWRVKTSTVDDLKDTPSWKARTHDRQSSPR